jgi:hypothetical protein
MSDEPTPGAQRAITPTTQFRADLRTLVAIMGTLMAVAVAAALWASNLEHKVDDLRGNFDQKVDDLRDRQIRQEAAVDQIRAALGINTPTARTLDDRKANP